MAAGARFIQRSRRNSMDFDVNTSADKPTDDVFDPVMISKMRRNMADAMYDDPALQALLADLQKQQDSKTAFSHCVEALRQSQATPSAEMSSEMQLIKATVGFGLYVVKSSPDLKNTVHSAMTALLNNNLCKWVTEQGGWNKVNI